ncbi:YerC/YecD family TrpR-related protein [Olsenella uli]|uniref:YerC/YecD family TrpR-related protein n=1 Tax=Olsenella uli TaxID=133926 RepID=UPI0012AC5504|nr:YerC/YecD family TrpR-related protein [Olsenella uli]
MDAREVMASESAQVLAKALAQIETAEEASALLLDLCTPREIEDLSQRLEVARLLDAGEPYLAVQQRTGASSTTVSRVSKCLNGAVGGYRGVLDRMESAE